MDFELTEDQRTLRAAVRELTARFPDEYWAERDEHGEFPHEFYAAFAEGGWLGV
ncbi:MAG TPA: acyl-CoA dehydrogenase family protein [Pseudonocardia sp.]|nr:acyl-CoA dehydrogenase family protein [Pseudonocardia sp.]